MATRPLAMALDIQGFVDNNGELIPKEIAWVSFGNDEEIHAIIEAPCAWETLIQPAQKVNDWLTGEKHGLLWELPGIPQQRLEAIYRIIPPEINLIYVYDNKIANYLSGFKHQKIITIHRDLPFLGTIEPKSTFCLQHQKLMEEGKQVYCAKVNALRIRQFVQTTYGPHPNENQQNTPHLSWQQQNFNTSTKQYAHPEFAQTDARTYSFFNWHKPSIEIEKLVEEGMFYTGDSDVVQCYACGIKLSMWIPGDNIKIRHCLTNPECILIKE